MFDGKKLTITDVVATLSVLVGVSFVHFVVTTMGYFDIIGPGMTGWFLEANLIQGAALSIRPVAITATIVCFILAFRYIISNSYLLLAKIPHIKTNLDRILSYKKHALATIYFMTVIPALIIIDKDSDNFSYHLVIFIIIMILILSEFLYTSANEKNRLFIFLMVIPLTYIAYVLIFNLGSMQAIKDLNNNNNRYDVYTNEKSYINVIVLKSTYRSIILKVANEIIFYDREQIKRIDRKYVKEKFAS